MAKFGKQSLQQLATCDPRLQAVLQALILDFDFSINEGHRGEEEQTRKYNAKKSKVKYPNSKHNAYPSLAADIVPYEGKQLWGKDTKEILSIGRMIGRAEILAKAMGATIRCGLDWDQDGQTTDETFTDSFHIELLE